ncbi:MAG: hypothetical protein DPW18_01400 [Chloroflexi bacterium]|nr:hypothetical protein [Chloroflexota bacterium]MDL1940837.1 PAS domain S-box protein [Chloroflexi bacterium CFX2]
MRRTLSHFWNSLNQFNALEPDAARRGKVLNLLLLGSFALSAAAFLLTLILLILSSTWSKPGNLLLLFGTLVFAIGALGLLFLNKRSTRLTALLFLLLLTLVFIFSDIPAELANGRSSFVFFIPIAIASLLLTPVSSFFFAVLNSSIIGILALISGESLNIGTIFGFFMLAIISWLSSNSLEQAIKDLRVINAELDQRVADRTRELSESLAREAAQASQREAILNSIADGVVVFDNYGMAIVANPSLSVMTGKAHSEVLGRNLTELLSTGELSQEEQARISEAFKGSKSMPTFRIKWGAKTLSVNAAEVQSATREPLGTVAVFRDVTREAELDRMKDTFLAVVSHELRTPLNAILGFAEMIKETVYGPVSESQSRAASRIMENTRRLLSIVSELLDQAQIQSGRLKIAMEPCEPAELLKIVQDTMEKIANDKGVKIRTELDPALPATLTGDSHRLQQILINLTNNAIKFSDKGDEIRVSIGRAGDANWQIQVADAGEGIPEEAVGYIFDTFRQVESSATRKHGGVGLGLAIVKQLVELMNGKIVVESRVNVGSVFTVTLPLITN